MIIEVTFGKTDHTTLRWELLDTSFADKWAFALWQAIPAGIREHDRFHHFHGHGWTKERIAEELNRNIQIIDDHYPVPMRASLDMSQAHFNLLHTYIETLRGTVEEPTLEWEMSSPEVRRAMEDFNVLIHRWEDMDVKNSSPRFVCTFKKNHRTELEDDDYQDFSTTTDYGDMLVDYCQVGKSIFDAYRDGMTLEHALPLRTFSADFVVRFLTVNDHYIRQLRQKFDPWLETQKHHLEKMGLHPSHPKLSLGHLRVAKLIDPPAIGELHRIMAGKHWIHDVQIV